MCKGIHLARERMIAVNTFKWMSHEQMYVDEIHVEKCGPLSVGVYGGIKRVMHMNEEMQCLLGGILNYNLNLL